MFREFAAPPNSPETLDDFIYSDTPQLSLYITSFKNATLVGLSWPHTLMDVMGQQAILKSWSLVLAGRNSEVPAVLGAREDAMSAIVDAPVEKEEAYGLMQQRLKGWGMAMFGLRFTGDMLLQRVVETRTICIPKKTMESLREEALSDLKAQHNAAGHLFVSEGDVLTAWSLRAVAASLPAPRPIAALHALNTRFRLPTLANAPGVYIQNMAVAAFTLVSHEVAVGPLGTIALENRRHLMEQSTEPQVLAYLRELNKEQASGGDPASMLFCDSNALLLPFTNWTRADFVNTLDFGPAVVHAGAIGESRKNPPGSMRFHHASSMRQSPTVRNVVVVMGKDHDENYWLTGTLVPRSWMMIEEELKRLRTEVKDDTWIDQ